MPGPDYATRFLKRHQNSISLRMCQNIKKSRAQVSPDTINEYFQELEESLKEIDPKNIVNYDETNLSDDPGRKKVIVKRGTKYPERVLNQSKSSIYIMMAGTAAGELLPPYVIYKANNIYDTWTTGRPKGTRFNRTASGWIDGSTFEDYIKSIIIPFFKDKSGNKVMIGDNLSSHLSIEVIRMCEQHNISFIFLPANSTHLTQPLDIAFFRPMKIAWRIILLKWKKTDGRTQASVPKGCFPRLLKLLINELSENVETNLKAGFRKVGIIPVDCNQVLSRLPSNENEDPDKSRYAVDKLVLQILKEMRYDTMNIKEPTRKRKLHAESGKSLRNIDDDNLESTSEHEITNKIVKICKQGNKKKKVIVIPGKSVNIDPESNDSENKEIENTDPENILIHKSTKKKEVLQLIDKLKNDLMDKDRTESKRSMLNSDKKNEEIDINRLPLVCVDEYDIINNSQEDEELLINNYIDESVSSIDYLPNIETEEIFSEIIDPLQGEMCENGNSKVLEKNEEKKVEDKKIEIISVEKVENARCGVNLRKCKKIPLNTVINIKKEKTQRTKNMKEVPVRRGSYYKNDADILRDLTDNNF
ncbi:unnamed protein product [Arctia plantaginis]|uniref:DDE-1 domain-containing protein n=1 Tax=Arctia plantaginis TaxID=874455 RepID=A0A8S1AM81_ARCPL|nr:unnamed protein product [Arctia plantaginis]